MSSSGHDELTYEILIRIVHYSYAERIVNVVSDFCMNSRIARLMFGYLACVDGLRGSDPFDYINRLINTIDNIIVKYEPHVYEYSGRLKELLGFQKIMSGLINLDSIKNIMRTEASAKIGEFNERMGYLPKR